MPSQYAEFALIICAIFKFIFVFFIKFNCMFAHYYCEDIQIALKFRVVVYMQISSNKSICFGIGLFTIMSMGVCSANPWLLSCSAFWRNCYDFAVAGNMRMLHRDPILPSMILPCFDPLEVGAFTPSEYVIVLLRTIRPTLQIRKWVC